MSRLNLTAVLMICLAFCSTAQSHQMDLTCALWPVMFDDENELVLFYCEQSEPANCNNYWPVFGWFPPAFEAWPENCPDCPQGYTGYGDIGANRGLPRVLKAQESLCCSLPRCLKVNGGRSLDPRLGLSRIEQHDVQIRPAAGGQAISVRLFEAQLNPGCVGLKGQPRTIRFGMETDRPVVADCRPFTALPAGNNAFQARVDYHGKRFAVMTKTRIFNESLASVVD
jgi:hypothetical protein